MAAIPTLAQRDIVVIGGSAGGIGALRKLLPALPQGFPAAIFVVVHVAPESPPPLLAEVLAHAASLPVDSAHNGMPVMLGRVAVARPDCHLMLEDGIACVTHGPRENAHRPSIDVLFRSAAATYGPRAIGVVLSGMLDDGAAGLWAIKRRGGMAIVQDPSDAEYPELPRNAIKAAQVDFCVPLRDIAARLVQLAGQPVAEMTETVPREMAHEVRMAAEINSDMQELDDIGRRTPFTCPECGGALWELSDTGAPRFRCHVGHGYSMHTFASQQSTRVEAALWAAVRSLQEKERLARRLAVEAGRRGNQRSETFHQESATESAAHTEVLRGMLTQAEPAPAEPGASGATSS